MTIQELTEKIKDLLEKGNLETLAFNNLLSEIRMKANVLDQHVRECQLRQNIYAEISEKILNRIIDREYP